MVLQGKTLKKNVSSKFQNKGNEMCTCLFKDNLDMKFKTMNRNWGILVLPIYKGG